MAVDMFMKIAKIDGESKDKVHHGTIDVLAWSWGASQSGTPPAGPGVGAAKAQFQDISFTKYVDKSSPVLFTKLAKGTHLTDATLIIRKAGDNPLEYLTIKMTEV